MAIEHVHDPLARAVLQTVSRDIRSISVGHERQVFAPKRAAQRPPSHLVATARSSQGHMAETYRHGRQRGRHPGGNLLDHTSSFRFQVPDGRRR